MHHRKAQNSHFEKLFRITVPEGKRANKGDPKILRIVEVLTPHKPN